MKISQIKTRAPFNELFPIDSSVLSAIKARIDAHGYDESQPIVIWDEEGVVVDGHSRLQAAMDLGLEEVPVHTKTFRDEDAALEYAIHNQRHRRNLTEAELLRCIEAVDRRQNRGGDRRSEEAKSKPPNGGIEKSKSPSAQDTARIVGVSTRKVERARAVLAEPQAAAEVKAGKKKISRAYQEIQANRKRQNQPELAKNQEGARRAILKKALTEIQLWRERYKDYPELSAIVMAIDGCRLNLELMEMLAKADGAHHADVESDSLEPSPSVFVGERPQLPDAGNDEMLSNSDALDSTDKPSPPSAVIGASKLEGQLTNPGISEKEEAHLKKCDDCRKFKTKPGAAGQEGACEKYPKFIWRGDPVSGCPHFELKDSADLTDPK